MPRAVTKSAEEPAGDPAAVIGVVIAGVLAAFVSSGPYDWGSTLLGAILLLVLIAYGHFPSSGRQALGAAAATAFALLFLIGRWPDLWFAHRVVDGKLLTWMTDWPVNGMVTRGQQDQPASGQGIHTLIAWSILFLVAYAVLWVLATPRGQRLRSRSPGLFLVRLWPSATPLVADTPTVTATSRTPTLPGD